MAYCPIAQGGDLLASPTLKQIARRHEVTPAQVSLAWVLRQDGVIAIPKAVTPEHVRLNAAAAKLVLDEHDLDAIDRVLGRRSASIRWRWSSGRQKRCRPWRCRFCFGGCLAGYRAAPVIRARGTGDLMGPDDFPVSEIHILQVREVCVVRVLAIGHP